MDHAKRGADLLNDKKYTEAVEAYTAALKAAPTSPDYFIKRSTAYQRCSPPDYASALADAEHGVVYAQKRAKRELIIQAQLRRAIALFGLARYADAGFVLDVVKRLDTKEKSVPLWESKIKSKLAGLGPADEASRVVVKETPDLTPVAPTQPAARQETQIAGDKDSSAPASSAKAPAPAQTPANKIRHDWYQTNDTVIFTLLAKGVPKDSASIDIKENSLSITFPLVNESTYEYTLDPLYAAIEPSQSKSSILSTKVELTLRKRQPGHKWHALEGSGPVTSDGSKAEPIPSHVIQPTQQAAGPSYPTSSRSGPKNWDKLANDLTTKKPKKEDGEQTSAKTNDGNDDDDDDWDYEKEGGDDVNEFFKKLYKDASPEVRRAMMKSYTESNGTALSTNWAEVSKGTVETKPPDSMVAKKWGE